MGCSEEIASWGRAMDAVKGAVSGLRGPPRGIAAAREMRTILSEGRLRGRDDNWKHGRK